MPESREELQERSFNEAVIRAEAFQAMIYTEGWKLVRAYYENGLKDLVNTMMLADAKQISDFEPRRRELMGIQKLMASIDADLETAKQKKHEEVR